MIQIARTHQRQGNKILDAGLAGGRAGHDPVGDVAPVVVIEMAFAGHDLGAGLAHGFEHIGFSNIASHRFSPFEL